jgi:hypothetical protein
MFSKITRTHKKPPNVTTQHVVSKDSNSSRRKKRQHQRSYSKKKFKSDVTEAAAVPSETTSDQDCTKYLPESKTTSDKNISDNISTSESSEKWPLLAPRLRISKRTGSAGSQASNHDTAGRTSSQNISQIHSDDSLPESYSSSTGVLSHSQSSTSTQFSSPSPSFKECRTDNPHKTEIPSDEDNGFQYHSQQAHIPQQQLTYRADSLENDENEGYFTPQSESEDESQKEEGAEFLQV